jgi:integrase
LTGAIVPKKPKTPSNGLTSRFLDNLRPIGREYEVADKQARGLRVRVTPRGAVSFVWYWRDGERTRRHTFGRYGNFDGRVSLKQARSELIQRKELLSQGVKPLALADGVPGNWRELIERYYRNNVENVHKAPIKTRQALDHDILPVIGSRKLNAVTRATIADLVERIVRRGSPSQAETVLGVLRQLDKYAVTRGYIEHPLTLALDKRSLGVGYQVGTRALDIKNGELNTDNKEIYRFWHDIDKTTLSKQVKIGLKLLLLTGVRSGELRLAKWDEFDFERATWTIPSAHVKRSARASTPAHDFTVPLTPLSMGLLQELKAEGFDYVIGCVEDEQSGDLPLSERALSKALRRQFSPPARGGEPPLAMEPFTPHDLRRTVRTHLAILNIPPHIAEKTLNHSLGTIERTYNKYSYLDERRAAMETWHARIVEIIKGASDAD